MSPGNEDFSCFSTKPAASANINWEETFRGAGQHLLSSGGGRCLILTFLAQNYVIPSGSMEKHVACSAITWSSTRSSPMPPDFVDAAHQTRKYRGFRGRGDIVVFHKPVNQLGIDATDADGTPQYNSPW